MDNAGPRPDFWGRGPAGVVDDDASMFESGNV